jgi:hypothetical protein
VCELAMVFGDSTNEAELRPDAGRQAD